MTDLTEDLAPAVLSPAVLPIASLMDALRARGIRLRADGDRLSVTAPEGALTPELRRELSSRKPEVLAFLADSRRAVEPVVEPIRPAPRGEPLPASFAQQRLWFLEQRGDAGAAYVVPLPMRLRGPLDADALERALGTIVGRHEALRTVFRAVDGAPFQDILPANGWRLTVERTGAMDAAAALDAATPFDLARDYALRARLLVLGDDDHALLLAFHHIAFDGWSAGVFLAELTALYRAFRRGEASPLAALPLQYADFAVWQRRVLSGERLARDLDYWSGRLSGAVPVGLPADRPRRPGQAVCGAGRRFTLPADGLDALCRERGVTPFMALLAVFQVLLLRLTGVERVTVGSPVANRNRGETEGLIGFFVNALALSTDLSGDPDFLTVLDRVRETALGAFAHQDLPFERLVEALRPDRDPGAAPLFQTVFALLAGAEPAASSPTLDGLAASPLDDTAEVAVRFDLEMHLRPGDGVLHGLIAYDRALYDEGSIDRLIGQYRRLLAGLLADPAASVSAVPLTDAGEDRRLAALGRGPSRVWPAATLVDGLAQAVASHPNAVAVEDAHGSLTYAELDRMADGVAAALADRGIGQGALVGWRFDRSAAMVAALCGILRSGAAYLPIDPEQPRERQERLVELSGAALVLDADEIPAGQGAVPLPPAPDDVAYVIYTSGSTGEPKGVEIPHRGAVNLAYSQIEGFAIHSDGTLGSRVLQFASPGFDASVSEIFTALLAGACLCLAPRTALLPGPDLLGTLRDRRITVATLPPVVLQAMAAIDLPDLATLVSAGAACTPEIVARWGQGRRFINAYGPTEVSVCATMGAVREGDTGIGAPLPNVTVRLLDGHGRLVPVGVPGELCVGGPGLARGYRGRPELTAERFRADPVTGDRLYHTGDRARWRADGTLEFLGRIDDQVKVRGVRVEPGEVESALRQVDGVIDAAVVDRAAADGDRRLVAYYVGEPGTERVDGIEIWPSIAEFFVYDELLYHALASDERRDRQYRAAIAAAVKGRVVVDVGTGGEAVLARLCVEAGARHVYAIELLEASYRLAQTTIRRHGLEDRITLIHGDATTVTLPEIPEVCVSEIVGSLGGSEGAAVVLNAVRRRYGPGLVMLPARSLTLLAPVELPADLLENPAFAPTGAHYAERVFATEGGRFDLRLCLRRVGYERLLSEPGLLEELDFTGQATVEATHANRLRITRDGSMAGLLAWLTLDLDGRYRVDTLAGEHSWLPVFLPVFDAPVPVVAGDVVEMDAVRTLCTNGINPDFRVTGRIVGGDGRIVPFDHTSWHRPGGCGGTAMHRRLFAGESLPVARPTPTPAALRAALERQLPDAFVPQSFHPLARLPLTPAGKVDRRALASRDEAADHAESVQAVLSALPGVTEAAVVPVPAAPPVALVVAGLWEADEQGHVGDWRRLYETLHAEAAAEDPFHGWRSTITGQPIPAALMQDWLDRTIERILSLPVGRALEIGCGTGQILDRVAPHAASYLATDISQAALDRIAGRAAPHVRLERREAEDLPPAPPGGFDLIILNSVIQYFPSLDYLARVVAGCRERLAPDGALFIGDIRHLGLLETFHAQVEAATGHAARRAEDEPELLVDPGWFRTVPGFADTRALVKRGLTGNELTDFRYDAVLRRAPVALIAARTVPWPGLEALPALLRTDEALAVTGVPNGRLLSGTPEPEALWLAAEAAGRRLDLAWDGGGDPRTITALFSPAGAAADAAVDWQPPVPPAGPFANTPLRARQRRDAAAGLSARLAAAGLRANVRVVDAIPRRPDGCPDVTDLWSSDTPTDAPATATEGRIAALWRDLLGVEAPARGDDFFALGGHSLLGTRLVSRLRDAFGVDLPVKAVFESPTLAELAARVDAARAQTADAIPALADGVPAPLSFAQNRLWFLGQLVPDDPFYNIPVVLRLRGRLDPAVLAGGLTAVAGRHDLLRARIDAAGAEPLMVIEPPGPVALTVADCVDVADAVRALARTPIPLTGGVLWRVHLLRVAADDHVLVAVLHHIIGDGWSAGLFLRDLADALKGRELTPLPVRYGAFAAWQRAYLTGAVLERQVRHWTRRLAGLAPLDLPTDRPRPAVQSFEGATEPFALSAAAACGLEALAKAEGATLFMVLLAAFQTLLHRVSGADDVAVGVPIAGRARSDVEDIIGLFVNTLVMRADLSGGPPFRALLGQVRDTALDAFAHQDLPFEKLIEALRPARDLSRNPLVQVMFSLQNAPMPDLALPGLAVEPVAFANTATRFDVEMNLWAAEGGALHGSLTYATALFDAATVRRLLDQFRVLLEAVAADPACPLGRLPLLDAAGRDAVIAMGRRRRTIVADGTLHGRFAAQAAARPDAPAVGVPGPDGAVVWTGYGALHRRASAVAGELRRRGVGPGRRVGLLVERTADGIAGLIGILLAGGAYVPLDPAAPAERIAFMVEDASVPLVVGHATLSALAPAGVPFLALDSLSHQAAEAVGEGGPADAAYVIYTSGSTGRPKGVVVEHGHALRLFQAIPADFTYDRGHVWSLFHSLAFDFSVWELWGALLHGGRVLLVPDGVRRAPDAFHALAVSVGVTVLSQTPSAFTQFMAADAAADTPACALRWVIFGGEALDFASLRDWFARRGDGRPRLVNMYGITETTVHVSWRPVSAADTRGASLIGRPLDDLDLHILDEGGQPLPVGVPGEMYVGGGGVARGYLNRPELDAQRFIPDPFTPGGRLYRTGDRARRLADGDIAYLGRADDQVKVRGYRIEPGEVRAALLAHPTVADAAVLAVDGTLAAYLVGRDGAVPDPAELQPFLRLRLPAYMVPGRWAVLPVLPLTRNGKLDRAALPRTEAGGGAVFAAPERPLERDIAAVWCAALKRPQVGLDDNFFDVGGHSLLTLEVRRGIEERLGRPVTVVDIFQYPTVRLLARHLEGDAAPAGADGDDDRRVRGRQRLRGRFSREQE